MDFILGTLKIKNLKSRFLIRLILIALVVFSNSCSKELATRPLTVGYLLNSTHAVPILGIETGEIKFNHLHFYSGGYLLNSLLTDNLDLAYIGPGPYINAKSRGIDLKILDIAASGGNTLILSKRALESDHYDLGNLAIPQQGNTQDLLAKYLVKKLNLKKKVSYIPVHPGEMEMLFFTKSIDSAMVSEPWGTLLSHQEDLLDSIKLNTNYEKSNEIKNLMDEINSFPATLLVVKESFYEKNSEKINEFLKAHKNWKAELIKHESSRDNELPKIIEKHLEKIINKDLNTEFIEESLSRVNFSKALEPSQLETLEAISRESLYIY